MDDTVVMQMINGDHNLPDDDCGLDIGQSTTTALQIREQITASEQVLEDVAARCQSSRERTSPTDIEFVVK